MANAPYRSVLIDGSTIERCYRTDGEKRVPYGNWKWKVYDPSQRPKTKTVNLRTRDQRAALRKANEYVTRRASGAYDPWSDPAPTKGTTLERAAHTFLAEKLAGGAAPGTVETDRGHLDRLSRWVGPGALVRHVGERDVQAFVDAPKKDGSPRSTSYKGRVRASLMHFFHWAVGRGLVQSNPAEGVSTKGRRGRRGEALSEAEEGALLEALQAADASVGADRGWVRDWVEFGCRTGLRPGEQAALRWRAVDLDRREVHVGRDHRVKTAGSVRVVPVRGGALDVLARRSSAGRAPEGLVFQGAKGGAVAIGYLSKVLGRFAEAAGVEKRITAYSTRHTYGTRMVQGSAPIWDVAKLMGTSVAMIEKHYGHHDPARSAAHVDRVFG